MGLTAARRLRRQKPLRAHYAHVQPADDEVALCGAHDEGQKKVKKAKKKAKTKPALPMPPCAAACAVMPSKPPKPKHTPSASEKAFLLGSGWDVPPAPGVTRV